MNPIARLQLRPNRLYRVLLCCALATASPPSGLAAEVVPGLYAVWHTNRGEITSKLFFEEVPLTVAVFVGLAEGTIPFENRPSGEPFYDGLTFHRVAPGFVVQGGDPVGNGKGGPGFTFADQFSPQLKHDTVGTLAMANAGANTNGSQFYFTLSPVNRLNYKHTVFGRVTNGAEVLPLIEPGDVIEKIEIVRVGAAADAFRPDAAMIDDLRARTAIITDLDPARPALFANEAGLEIEEWYFPWISEKLTHYLFTTGITVRVRIVPDFEPPPANASTKNPVRFHHENLAGGDSDAATLFFVADENRWRIWIGTGLLNRFGMTVDSIAEDPGRTQLNELKAHILAEAKVQFDAGSLRRSIDVAVTNLIERLDATNP